MGYEVCFLKTANLVCVKTSSSEHDFYQIFKKNVEKLWIWTIFILCDEFILHSPALACVNSYDVCVLLKDLEGFLVRAVTVIKVWLYCVSLFHSSSSS